MLYTTLKLLWNPHPPVRKRKESWLLSKRDIYYAVSLLISKFLYIRIQDISCEQVSKELRTQCDGILS